MYSSAVEVNWILMWLHLVVLVTTLAIWVDTGHSVAIKNFKQAFSCVCSHTSGDTIRGNAIDPNDLVSNLDPTVRSRGSQGMTATKSHWEGSYNVQTQLFVSNYKVVVLP